MEFVEQSTQENVKEESNEVTIPIRNTLSEDPQVYAYHNYLTDEECDHFIKIGKPNLKRAYVSDTKQGTISKGRTGSNYWLVHNHDEITRSVGKRISELIGIPLENAESYQFIHYNETQKYDQHWDAYTLNDSEKCRRCLKYGGQRMVTCLLYLNTVEEGGGTRFPNLNLESKAEKGKMLVFHNCIPGTNTPHPNSLHAGCPVLKGEKYAINLWFREISMKKVYDFPFLKDLEMKKEEEKVTMSVEDNNTFELNSSNTKMEITSGIINAKPKIIQLNGLLNNEECKYILSQCKNGSKQAKDRVSYWVKYDNTNANKILDKFANILNIKDKSYFESMNIMEYPKGSDHGCHFDAFDLTSERGKTFSKSRGQRLYTFVCLLSENNDQSNGRIEFRNYPKDIVLNQGDCVLYKNTENEGDPLFQRNSSLEYAVGPCRNETKKYLYLYLREKVNGNQLTLKNVQDIDFEVEHINMNINTKVKTNDDLKKELAELNAKLANIDNSYVKTNVKEETKEKPKEEENYYDTLETFYDKLNTCGNVQIYKSLKSRRHNPPVDYNTLKSLYNFRQHTWSDTYKSLVQTKHFEVDDYKQDEFTPIVIDNVFTDEVRDLFIDYFKNTIDNDKFQFGDKQSQRYKAYDDLMSRIMQYECLPIIEKITKKKLRPTYTYFSGYAKDADLPPHTDRPECEFTVSFLVAKPEGTNWPIYVDKKKQPIKFKGRYRDYVIENNKQDCVQVDCNAGGLMCFQGTDHIHFREKLEHDYYYITLLHYQIIE